ncbi:MAG TPA: hypothetical protein VML35_02495 [Gaiellaceae bacterium]|nr:hypothetical protein [Gaiellaceae bacterium]
MADPLDRESVALYGRPRAEFTAARNLRAKELKPDDPELAAAVEALPKPTVAAAALNELVREDPSEIRALVQSGKRLREAQEKAVAGKQGPNLAAAIAEHRAALDRVRRDLQRRKLSGATLEKALKTVRIASLDPETQPLLGRGTLAEDLTASGFGLDPGLVAAQPKGAKPKPAPPKPDRKAEEKRRREAQSRLRDAEAALEEAEQRAKAAQRDVERAAAEVERARRRAEEP